MARPADESATASTPSKVKTFRNVIYTTLTRGATLVCSVLASSVVARNITPADYGVVGFAGIIIGFLDHFSDVSVGTAAIRRRTLDRRSLRTAFTLKVVLSVAACLAAFLIAPFAHYFFEHPATGDVIRVLSLSFLASTIGFMSLVTLTREQNYRALVIPGISSAVVRTILSIVLIWHGWSYWAVILGNLGATLTASVVTGLVRRVPLGFEFNRADAQEYLRFGMPLLGGGVLNSILMNVDNFLVGSGMGSTQLGYYALAFTWGSFICGLVADTVNSVLLPAFSVFQDDPASMRRWYLKTVDLVAFIAVVANSALFANAHFFLVSFLGKGTEKWLPATASLRILCIYGIVRVVTEPLGNCIVARGRTKLLLHANAIAGAIELILIVLVLRYGRIELVAVSVLVAYASQMIVFLPFLRREMFIRVNDLVAQIWPVVPSLAVGYLVASLLPSWWGNSLVSLVERGFITASASALTHGCCTRFRCFHEMSRMISGNLARVRA